jgi:hypothetical protein
MPLDNDSLAKAVDHPGQGDVMTALLQLARCQAA